MTAQNRIYLACPYSHPDKEIRRERAHAANLAAANLMRGGAVVFSPISMGHAIGEAAPWLPYEFDFWQAQCLPHLAASTEVVVLTLVGWENSKGVAAEVAAAKKQNIPVTYMAA